MSTLGCCLLAKVAPTFVKERDLGSARGYEFDLGRCSGCGQPWLQVYCSASSVPGFERISADEANNIRAISDPAALKAHMRIWGDKLG